MGSRAAPGGVPYALFFSAVYTESLFLFLTVSAFYGMRRGRFGWVTACGLLAGLTRPNGFWLAAPLACLAWSQYWRAGTPNDAQGSVSFPRALAVSCAPIVGVAQFSAYLGIRFADPLAWLHGRAAWGLQLLGRASAPDPVTLPSTLTETAIEYVVYAGNIAAFVLAGTAMRPVAQRFGLAYAVWILINIVPAVADHRRIRRRTGATCRLVLFVDGGVLRGGMSAFHTLAPVPAKPACTIASRAVDKKHPSKVRCPGPRSISACRRRVRLAAEKEASCWKPRSVATRCD